VVVAGMAEIIVAAAEEDLRRRDIKLFD